MMHLSIDIEWSIISSRARHSPVHGGWDGWVRAGRREGEPRPGWEGYRETPPTTESEGDMD
jgi:hypothetical protein